jgi:hypothetical protein
MAGRRSVSAAPRASGVTPPWLRRSCSPAGELDFLVYDYLAEITMSIMARARAADPGKGYATDFVSAAMAPNLADRRTGGVRVVATPAGSIPMPAPRPCAREIAAGVWACAWPWSRGRPHGARGRVRATQREMFSGCALSRRRPCRQHQRLSRRLSHRRGLDAGADIVVTGRCVDSAVTLGACIHSFRLGSRGSRLPRPGQSRGPHSRMRHAGYGRQLHGLGGGR